MLSLFSLFSGLAQQAELPFSYPAVSDSNPESVGKVTANHSVFFDITCSSVIDDGEMDEYYAISGLGELCRHPRIKKNKPRNPRDSPREHMCSCPSVTCTVHPANRAHRAGHVEFHTRAGVKNPSSPNSLPSLTFVRPRDQLFHRVRFRTGSLTLATVHAGVSSVARHGPPVLYRA